MLKKRTLKIITKIIFLIIMVTTIVIQIVDNRLDEYNGEILLDQNHLLDLGNQYISDYLTVLRIENAQFFGAKRVKFGTFENIEEKEFENIEEEKIYYTKEAIEHARQYEEERKAMNSKLNNPLKCFYISCNRLKTFLISIQIISIIILALIILFPYAPKKKKK